jgi:hypothetical protein
MPPLIYDSADSEDEEEGDVNETSEEEERDERGQSTPPRPLLGFSLQELADQGYNFHLLYKESGNSLEPAYSESNVRFPPGSAVPDDDGLYLCTISEETRHIPIPLAKKIKDHQEDFTLLGGDAPRPSRFNQNSWPTNEENLP